MGCCASFVPTCREVAISTDDLGDTGDFGRGGVQLPAIAQVLRPGVDVCEAPLAAPMLALLALAPKLEIPRLAPPVLELPEAMVLPTLLPQTLLLTPLMVLRFPGAASGGLAAAAGGATPIGGDGPDSGNGGGRAAGVTSMSITTELGSPRGVQSDFPADRRGVTVITAPLKILLPALQLAPQLRCTASC